MFSRSYELYPELLHDNSQVLGKEGHVGGSLGQPRHDCVAGGVHSDALCSHHICHQALSHFPSSLEKMVGNARNQLAPLLEKLLNTDGTPSDKNLEEIKEALRKLYFDWVTSEKQ